MRRFNSSFTSNTCVNRRVSLSTHHSLSKRFCSTTTSSSSSSQKFQFYQTAGKAAGVILPFVGVWMATSYLFPTTVPQIEIIQPAQDLENNGDETKTQQQSLGGPFELVDCCTKKVVTDKDVFTAGSSSNQNQTDDDKKRNKDEQLWSLLYFGFSKCAEVCPRNLKFMTDAIENLSNIDGGDAAQWKDKVQIVFVSVDPIRDKPEVLEKYLNERIPESKGIKWRGLCGNSEQISSICTAWRVYYSSMNESAEEKEAREAIGMSLEEALGKNNENYQLDHSAAVYFIAPGGKLRDLFFDEMGVKHASDRIDLHLSGSYSGLNQV